MKTTQLISYFTRNIFIVVGLVMIWRGVWYILDEIDIVFFGKSHVITTILGIVIGLLVLYLPDKDLKEISKL